MKTPTFLLVFIATAFSAFVFAETGSIQGKVLYIDDKALPGVTVTLEKCGMTPKTTYTGDAGKYTFQNLEPGIYSITFDLQGFEEVHMESVGVEEDRSTDLNTIMTNSKFEIVIGCGPPLVDTKKTSVVYKFDAYEQRMIPTKHDLWSVIDQTPGIDLGISEDKRIR